MILMPKHGLLAPKRERRGKRSTANGTKNEWHESLPLERMPKVHTIRLSKGTPNKDLRMSNENEKLREEIKELHNMVDDLSGWVAGVEADNDTLRKEIARLKEERDLARREICRWEASATGKRITECAKLNEWDCFKNEVVDANANNQDFRSTDMG
jgi:hypothetical protein